MTEFLVSSPRSDAPLAVPPTTGVLSTTVIEPAARLCQNCQTVMHGPFCYQCGQHERSSLRHAGLLLRDILHDVFNLDSRALRTLKPLLLKPGFLTLEYFAGRRQRYVPPLRLYVIASLLFFLIAGLTFDVGDVGDDVADGLDDNAAQENNTTQDNNAGQDAVAELRNDAEFQAAMQEVRRDPVVAAALDEHVPGLQQALAQRAPQPVPAPEAPAIAPAAGTGDASASPAISKPESASANDDDELVSIPDNLSFLPAFANRWLAGVKAEVKEKSKQLRGNPKRLIEAVLSVLPQSMFILLPLFALLLKLFYPFANRLYMEHLIVALHSHSFMFLLFTLMIAVEQIVGPGLQLAEAMPWLAELLSASAGLLSVVGVPLYLYLMQKRVYGQSHGLTFGKYFLIGLLYTVLLSVVIAVDIVVGILQL